MRFYNNMNNGTFENQYEYALFEAKRREKKALWINASKLGILLIVYNLLSNFMVSVYYYLVYIYRNHSITLSFNEVLRYLRGEKELIASSMFSMLGNLFSVSVSLGVTIIIAYFIMKIDFSQMLRPEKRHIKQAAVWFPVCMVINFTASLIAALFTVFMKQNGITVPQSDISLSEEGALTVIVQILYVIIIGPIAEEFIYRGLIITLLKPFGKWLSVFFSALIFGLMHGNIPQAAAAFAGALIYGLIAVRFNSIVPTIIIHTANNFVASYSDFSEVYNLPMEIYYGVMIIFALSGVYIAFTKFRELIITNEARCVLTSGERYRTVFTNIFILIFLFILILAFVRSFYYANM